MLVITVRNVNKAFKKVRAVRDLSFDVEEATCFGMLGPNGAGKTTMMRMIYGRSLRDGIPESVISVFSRDPATNELEIKYLSGVVPQENNLDEELNVRENLLIYANFYGIPRGEALSRIRSLLDFLELSEKFDARIRELSGGMKRRLVIARALLNNPRLLILDEPTTGLDPQVRHLIWDKLRQLKKSGITILLTTHYMDEAFELCDKIIIMHKGSKIMEGSPRDLLADHIEAYVLEILNKETAAAIEKSHDLTGIRKDGSHEVTLYYSNDMTRLRSIADRLETGRFHLRQSNLEDLFLKTTGRALSES
jgi:lipooligosaccharide transport system ATP-binding protein